jgi:hypothetical protein
LGAGEVIGEMLGPRKGGPVMQELDVYHGTPHRFPATEANPLGEFDASKIGTGEGAQAYGHGIYYAENPQVAGMYRSARWQDDELVKALKTPTLTKDEYSTLGELTRKSRSRTEKLTDAEQSTLERLQSQQRRQAEELFAARESTSTLYKADLPDEMIDRMLDWDKPLSEQPAAVRKALMENPVVAAEVRRLNAQREALNVQSPQRLTHPVIGKLARKETTAESLKGQALYELLAKGSTQVEASAYLKSLGIPGIKYLDAGSRGQGGSGTRNFVVFPGEEKKVRILERK